MAPADKKPTSFPDNLFTVQFKEKKDELKDFDQTLVIKKQEKARVDYQKKKNQSIVTIKEWKQRKEKEKMDGMKIIQLLTNRGTLEAEIK